MSSETLFWDGSTVPPDEMRHLLYSLVIPRPIAWISTLSSDGIANLAPHSFFNAVSGIPPIVMFASTRPHGDAPAPEKDTLRNIIDTGEFVINLVNRKLATAMNKTGRVVPPEIDEFELAGLQEAPSRSVRPHRVAGAAAALECRLHSTTPIGDATVVFGTVVSVHIDASTMQAGRPDPRLIAPIARLGGALYAELGEVFAMKRE